MQFKLPPLEQNRIEDLFDQIEILDFPLANPFDLVNDDPYQYLAARKLDNHLGQTVTLLLYYIDYKPVRTSNGQRMAFGTFVDVHLDWVDTVHFADSLQKYPLTGRGFYKVTGKVVADFEVYSVEVHYMHKVGYKKTKIQMPV